MRAYTHGKCTRCKRVLRWQGRPLLRDALCPGCKHPLDRTAASLVKKVPVMDLHPLELVR